MLSLSRLEMEIGGLALILAIGTAAWIHHDSVEQAKGAISCQDKVAVAEGKAAIQAATREQVYADQLKTNQVIYSNAINSLPAPITTPVYIGGVRLPDAVCSQPSNSAPSETASVHPDTGGNGPGSGERDIRPGIEAFKMRYSKSLLACKMIFDDWPGTSVSGN